ncbi:MAG: WecB/TagA/CpsF family glycosyltransferase [Candidatus Gracilibacteria bacterium]|jgi:N-acetylglucosaminyldiphosphoundecaprenol N-acetyl-beta-D-mannosaminyltransferase
MKERITIMNVPFDRVTAKEALAITLEKLDGNKQTTNGKHQPFFIATPNPEMLLAARKNERFLKILQTETDLNIPDGIGIIFASKLSKNSLPQRVTGTDLMQAICHFAPKGTKIFLLGAAEGVAEKVKAKLQKKYPQIQIVGTHSGSPAPEEAEKIRNLIQKSEADILFIAFGAPKQELWLSENLSHLKNLKIAMGVGGAFDFVAEIRKRAPRLMRKLGLEWLFRLVIEPSRFKRIYNATIKFPLLFLKQKITGK